MFLFCSFIEFHFVVKSLCPNLLLFFFVFWGVFGSSIELHLVVRVFALVCVVVFLFFLLNFTLSYESLP